MESSVTSARSIRLSNSFKETAVFVICLICVFLFLFSAYEKLVDHQRFYNGLSRVAIIGAKAEIISYAVPLLEVSISILLIIPHTQRKGLYGFAALMGIFTIYIFGMWQWAPNLPCHCNLIVEKLSWGQHIWFNLVFLGLAIIALVLNKSNINPKNLRT